MEEAAPDRTCRAPEKDGINFSGSRKRRLRPRVKETPQRVGLALMPWCVIFCSFYGKSHPIKSRLFCAGPGTKRRKFYFSGKDESSDMMEFSLFLFYLFMYIYIGFDFGTSGGSILEPLEVRFWNLWVAFLQPVGELPRRTRKQRRRNGENFPPAVFVKAAERIKTSPGGFCEGDGTEKTSPGGFMTKAGGAERTAPRPVRFAAPALSARRFFPAGGEFCEKFLYIRAAILYNSMEYRRKGAAYENESSFL